MKKYILILTILSTISLVGCGHEHTFSEATCESPKTCTECGETEGEKLSHNFLDATCESPKTCSLCNITEGEPLEHNWLEATIENPKTCKLCGLTEGEPLPVEEPEVKEEAPTEEYTLEQKKKELQELGVDISKYTDDELNSISTEFILMVEGVSKAIYESEVQNNTTHEEATNDKYSDAPIMTTLDEEPIEFGTGDYSGLEGGTME